MTRTCPECGTEFEPEYANSKYDTKACRDAARRKLNRITPPTAEEAAELSLERKLLSLEVGKATAERVAKAAKLEAATAQEELLLLQQELDLYTHGFNARPNWLKPDKDKNDHHGVLVSFLSDIHAGEKVDPSEMDDFNAFDMDICEGRLKRHFERTCMVARKYLAGVKYDGIVLALGGDLVSGDIHDELRETNLVSTYESVEFLVPLLAAGVEMFAEEFGKVHVVSAPGNHGRDSRKPRHKRRSAHNADTHVARLVSSIFEGSEDITFDVPASFDVTFKIYDYTFTMEHGDNMKFSGVSEIGAYGPAKRGTLRKSRQSQTEGRPFNWNLIGHFHQYIPAYTQGLVMNGSVKGYDEYARSWHFLPEPAQQALMVVTPEHGITVQAPILLQKRSVEGW
jgi:hypothetical protein